MPNRITYTCNPATFYAESSVTLETTEVVLTASNPSVPVRVAISDDDECVDPHRYTLTYTYTGPDQYSVIKNMTATITIEIVDGKDCLVSYS